MQVFMFNKISMLRFMHPIVEYPELSVPKYPSFVYLEHPPKMTATICCAKTGFSSSHYLRFYKCPSRHEVFHRFKTMTEIYKAPIFWQQSNFIIVSSPLLYIKSMEAVICDISALNYWRSNSDPEGSFTPPRAYEPASKGRPQVDTPSASLVSDLASWGLVERDDVNLLVASAEDRRRIKGVSYIVLSMEVPASSFVRALGQVYVVSPELLFIQLARRLPLVELLEVGYELCGTYRLDAGGEAATYNLKPLTSVSQLSSYARRAKGVYGRERAEQALQWLADNSASPAETALAIMFKLPRRLGGYGMGNLMLNHEIKLNENAASILGRPTIRPDLFWIEAKHPAEYDGNLFHSSSEQQEYDERRRNAYMAMGMSVTVFRPRHMCNINLMDEMAEAVRKNIGARHREPPKNYAILHRELFYQVFRFWTKLNDEYGAGRHFEEMARRFAAPETPW